MMDTKDIQREQVLTGIISERDMMILDLNQQVVKVTKEKEQLEKDVKVLKEKMEQIEGAVPPARNKQEE